MWFVADNHNYMCHIGAKGFLDLNFSFKAVIDKISNFHNIFTKIIIFKVYFESDRPTTSTL